MSARLPLAAAVTLALLSGGGCASIISGRSADVTVRSNPPNAAVVVRDKQGHTVAQTTTPGVVSLRRGAGPFRRARYTATIQKPGYETTQLAIGSTVNPWTAGNILFGGVVGLVIDPYTGAMWKPKPSEISLDLRPSMPGDVMTTSHEAIDPAAANQIR